MSEPKREISFVICLENSGHPESLELRKTYLRLADSEAEEDGFFRVVDESGEDYLYPLRFFAVILVPPCGELAFAGAECPEELPVPESHIALAEQRLADYRRDPTLARPAFEELGRLIKKSGG